MQEDDGPLAVVDVWDSLPASTDVVAELQTCGQLQEWHLECLWSRRLLE